MVPPNLSMCMKGDTLSSPYFFLMGHSKDTVCEKLHVSLSILIDLCALWIYSRHVGMSVCAWNKQQTYVCVCVVCVYVLFVLSYKSNITRSDPLQLKLHLPEEGSEDKSVTWL